MRLSFWVIDENDDDVYEVAEVTIGGWTSQVGLFIDELVLEAYTLSDLEQHLASSTLDQYDGLARTAFASDEVYVPDFVGFHLEGLAEQLAEKGVTDRASFLENLVVRAVGLTIEESGQLVCNLDYTIDQELSDELLVAYFTADGQLLTLSHES